jgi:hypothetical protein
MALAVISDPQRDVVRQATACPAADRTSRGRRRGRAAARARGGAATRASEVRA